MYQGYCHQISLVLLDCTVHRRPAVVICFPMCILWHVSIALIALALLFPDLIPATSIKADPDAVWSSIVPSTQLKYYPCYEGFECARLMVPLDWSAPEDHLDDKIATIAVIKLPAVVAPNHAHYGGTIITNPGGPGSSGVVDFKRWGRLVRREFDSADKHFDLVSFDPRGVLFTIPNALCFEDPMARSSWDIQATSIGNLDSGEQARTMLWARSKALGSLCESANNRSGKDVFKHMTTVVVARDMLALVEEIEHHRKLSTQGGLLSQSEKQALLHAGADANTTSPNLMFRGFPGGTIIGATFASMFPHRVGRMVLDGVVNADDYISNSWTTTFEDTEAVMQSFYQTCFDAGAGCALFHPYGPQAIEKEVKTILEQVENQSVPAFRHTTSLTPEIVTYSDVKRFIFWSLFSPLHTFPSLAQGLAISGREMRRSFWKEHAYLCNVPSAILLQMLIMTSILDFSTRSCPPYPVQMVMTCLARASKTSRFTWQIWNVKVLR